jgi:eukaryotic-like serine/threonine-protein kinase
MNASRVAAEALARSGDFLRARKIAAGLAKQYPQDTIIHRTVVPAVSAAIQIGRGDPQKTIDTLRQVVPYELASADGLYSAYLRGLAYLELHQGDEAAVEFERIFAHRGIVSINPIGALAQLQLARACVSKGDVPKARTAYRSFLTLRRGADADLPVLQQARREYGNLE